MYLLSMLPPASAKAATRRAVLGVAILQVLLNGETKPIKLDDVQEAMQNMKHRQQALKKTSGWMIRERPASARHNNTAQELCVDPSMGSLLESEGRLTMSKEEQKPFRFCDPLAFRGYNRWTKVPTCTKLGTLRFHPPQGCAFHDFDPELFFQLLRGRTLWIIGDSVSKQMFDIIVHCMLARYADPAVSVRVVDEPNEEHDVSVTAQSMQEVHRMPQGTRCRPNCGSFFRPGDDSVRICWLWGNKHIVHEGNAQCFRSMRESDVVLANLGLWYPTTPEGIQAYTGAVQEFADFFARSTPSMKPLLIWRETSEQHFPGKDGSFASMSKNVMGCTDAYKSKSEARANNVRNNVALPILGGAGISVLAVNHLTSVGWPQLHPAEQRRGSRKDCTHYCLYPGGIHQVWATLLQNVLLHKLGAIPEPGTEPSLLTRRRDHIFMPYEL